MEKSIMQESLFLDRIKSELETGEQDIKSYSPLVFAYIGDCVYELIIRCKLVLDANEQVQKLHKKATSLVKAETQARIIVAVMDELEEDEVAVYKRARNLENKEKWENADKMIPELKQQKDDLRVQLADINKRIKEVNKSLSKGK